MISTEPGPGGAVIGGTVDVWIDAAPTIGLPFHDAATGFALVQAFRSRELRIRGLSTSFGRVPLARAATVAHELVERFGGDAGMTPARVFQGTAQAEDFGTSTAAVRALRSALEERPLTYLALAPLTNLAALLRQHPALAGRIERVVFVGSRTPGRRFTAGRWNPYEFIDRNYHCDNAAAGVILRAGIPLTLVPMEAALQMPLLVAELGWLGREGGAAGQFLAERARGWMWQWRLFFLMGGGTVTDCFAVLAATHPHLLETESRFVTQHHALDWDAPQDHHKYLLASKVPMGRKFAREATFCVAPRPAAKAMLLERLAGKPYPVVD